MKYCRSSWNFEEYFKNTLGSFLQLKISRRTEKYPYCFLEGLETSGLVLVIDIRSQHRTTIKTLGIHWNNRYAKFHFSHSLKIFFLVIKNRNSSGKNSDFGMIQQLPRILVKDRDLQCMHLTLVLSILGPDTSKITHSITYCFISFPSLSSTFLFVIFYFTIKNSYGKMTSVLLWLVSSTAWQ